MQNTGIFFFFFFFFFQYLKLKISSENFDSLNMFAQNIDCGYTLEPPDNLWFGAKIRIIGILLYTPVLLYKSGI